MKVQIGVLGVYTKVTDNPEVDGRWRKTAIFCGYQSGFNPVCSDGNGSDMAKSRCIDRI